MNIESLKFNQWLNTPLIKLVTQWQENEYQAIVPRILGTHALQFGLPQQFLLNNSSICHKFILYSDLEDSPTQIQAKPIIANSIAWPLAPETLDLILLPLTLNNSLDLTTTLREATRTLRPEGRLLLTANNIFSTWGIARQLNYCKRIAVKQPPKIELMQTWVTHWHIKNWLIALGYQINCIKFGVYQLPFNSPWLINKTTWLNQIGKYIWPICGAVYFIDAVKRVNFPVSWQPNWQLLSEPFRINKHPSVAKHLD